jgi:hypothetical protein
MIEVNINTVILYRKDLKEKSRLKINKEIDMLDFYFDFHNTLSINKKDLVIFNDGNYNKILTSRYFSI